MLFKVYGSGFRQLKIRGSAVGTRTMPWPLIESEAVRIAMTDNQTDGRERSGAAPVGKPNASKSSEAGKGNGKREVAPAGRDGPSAADVGDFQAAADPMTRPFSTVTITRRESPRSDLLAFDVVGKIDKASIEAMAADVDRAFDDEDEIDILIVFRGFDGMEAGAAFDPAALSVEVRSLRHVRRYAVVGAPAFADAMIMASNLVSPIDAKTFDLAAEDQAWEWINRR